MKNIPLVIVLLASIVTGLALQLGDFISWDALIKGSSDIMIVSVSQCSYTPNRVGISDAAVVYTMKGDAKPEPLHLRTTYFPYQGERLLIFANHEGNQTGQVYDALEDFRVIPLNRFFQTNALAGKTLNEQIQLIVKTRLEDLSQETARDNAEKARLETAFSNNVLYVNPKRPLTGGGPF